VSGSALSHAIREPSAHLRGKILSNQMQFFSHHDFKI
jgi:hypothetical protein